ncbi:acyl-CoA carboxylase subunit epsilon [Kitasatospora sp. GP82]|uniref:acyl-CoA carboxylase subunit epsilon n=1 Tax=Kitasatospora sp. GP82 TaxID=3035089 RepID=UPI00247452C5|nr:acyl-CoA carboxylase subunit epsilon [Kitasatospora sp. GP82]MDH6124125.1 ABC-type sugar transport system substrate-binding protein [Kitasatospora sp. GP82]
MPPIQVLHGQPTPEELATVLAVVSARAAAAQAAAEAARRASGPVSTWNDRARRMRRIPQHGPGAWRSSGWAG